jgi:hypothetical protein
MVDTRLTSQELTSALKVCMEALQFAASHV